MERSKQSLGSIASISETRRGRKKKKKQQETSQKKEVSDD